MMGPQATSEQREAYVDLINHNPRNYIAQPMLNLSTVPTLVEDRLRRDTST
ncbi:MAG: circularly permuted type 2 ATP-grasp protein [Pirellulaceae bacterium]